MRISTLNGSNWKLYNRSMLEMADFIEPNSIDSIITDPPYELNFMNKGWDNSGIAFQADTWKKCYDALKAGGYLLAFGGSRTFHRIACAIEDAGFEIRDTIMWLYGSGFPKSMNIGLSIDKRNGIEIVSDYIPNNKNSVYNRGMGGGKSNNIQRVQNRWNGWGTALKPSYEPIIIARKPCEGSCTDNVIKYGVGGINIDECRVGNELIKGGTAPSFRDVGKKPKESIGIDKLSFGQVQNAERIAYESHNGRFHANTILTYDESDFDEVCGDMPIGGKNGNITKSDYKSNLGNNGIYSKYSEYQPLWNAYNDSGSAARYFYCAKASKRDRDEGLEEFESKLYGMSNGSQLAISKGDEYNKDSIGLNQTKLRKNTHPTVKPTSLMQYLVRLVTPKGGTVLDPFNGSGSTGKAVMYENKDRDADYKYIGIELNEEYIEISRARIQFVCGNEEQEDTETEKEYKQLSMWDMGLSEVTT